ncbi:hypothetical protein K7432_003120 [Basidiobolus ranarum]|uniref:RING-type domain-containing protein n=1 Tax=Basidiobolus ranarum TaxID=34480 RepID=A0ABR2X0M0_9FUNG
MNVNAPVFTPKLVTQSTLKPNIDRPKKPGHKHNKERLPRGSINQRDPSFQSSGQKNRSSTQRGCRSHNQVNSRSKATLGRNLITNTSSHDKSEIGEPNKRGQISMNHLLNFSLPPRQRPVSFAPRKSRTVHHQPFNKERFVNANFRFLVNPTGDYTVQLADPDVSIQWEDIEQVVITSQSLTTCPICLSKPCAARVTKCGHTYCYPCILHYLSVGEDKKKWRKCPVCWDAIYEKDLKSVQHREGLFLMRNDIKKNLVTFNLMQRPSISNIVLPRTSMCKLRQVISPETSFIPWDFTPSALSYSRLILPTLSYMEKEYIQAISELEDALKDAKGWGANEELIYINNSIEKTKSQLKFLRLSSVRESIEKIAAINMLCGTEAQPFTDSKISTEVQEDEFEAVINSYRENNKVHESAFSDCEDEHIHVSNSVNPHSIEISASTPYGALFNGNVNKETYDLSHQGIDSQEAGAKHEALVSDYFFYQSADGQHMYLHPIDVKILREEFGAYENFPDEISAPMIGFEESTINPVSITLYSIT